MFGSLVRRIGFWTLDALKGGTVRKNYKEIKDYIDGGNTNDKQLMNLVEHALVNVPYYQNKKIKDFNDFPIIDKNVIKENWDELHATNYLGKPVHYMSTSGSTGTPFTMEWDIGKRKRQQAEVIYFNARAGQRLGDREVYFRVWTEKNRKSKLELLKQNLVPIDILHLNDADLERIRIRLKKKPKINSCLGYASTFEYIARYINSTDDTPDMYPMKSIISGSEVLSMESKKLLKRVFGCKVFDRYSNEENGFLAQTEDMSDIFWVNTASFKIEVLKQDSNEPVEVGEVGRIVVTDLYSFAVPLIRYDTGDLAELAEIKNGFAIKLKTIQGRRVDTIYDTSGNRLTPHTLSVYMWKYEKLKQYQFIQEGEKEYTVKINGGKEYYSDDEMKQYLKSVFGQDAEITIEHVEGIPVLASGKFKKTICNYEKSSKPNC